MSGMQNDEHDQNARNEMPWLTVADVVAHWLISRAHLQRMMSRGVVRYHRIGAALRFRRDELLEDLGR